MKMMIKESRVCGAKHAFLALNYEKSIWVQNMQIFSGGFCKAFESPFSSSSAEKWLKSLWICETYGYDERRGFFCKAFYASVLCVLLFCILSQVCHITYWFFSLGLYQPIFWWSYPMRFGKYNVLSVKQFYKKGQF